MLTAEMKKLHPPQTATGTASATAVQPELFGLTATNMILLKRPKTQTSSPITVKACVSYPYGVFLGSFAKINITNLRKSFLVHCTSCQLTNCVDPSLIRNLQL